MQQAVSLTVNGLTLRGMEHVPARAEVGSPLPAVILYHSFTQTKVEPHRMYVKLCRLLESSGIACFRYDFSGSGESDGNFEDMTVSGELAEAQAILSRVRMDERVDPTRVSLLGFSLGGLVASLLAGQQPDAVRKLVLIAPAGNLAEVVQMAMRQVGITPETRQFDLEGNLVGRPFAEELVGLNALERAKPFSGPVLLVHGSADETVPHTVSEAYRDMAYAGRATLHTIPGAGHTFSSHVWEEELLQTVCDFLNP